jgi:mRNA-degrading endonuclease RelE of RelBE toxin-antitoxin system
LKSVSFEPSVLKQIRALSPAERQVVGRAIQLAQELFGETHRHAGAGLRKLSGGFYEVRVGLVVRLVFENAPRTCISC